jgi:hypothetical protein
MKVRLRFFFFISVAFLCAGFFVQAQELGPGFTKAQGKSLAEIKKELKMPEYADWHDQERLSVNIDAAYKSVKK